MPKISENRSVLSRAAPPPSSTGSYGSHPDAVIEEWLPVAASGVAVLLLHGGFWDEAFDRSHCRPLAAALSHHGIRVMLPEYRRVRGAGGWPQTFDDVRCAYDYFLAATAATRRSVVVGHSAGGQLALWLAATQPTAGLAAAVALAPVCDLVKAHTLGLGDHAIDRLMGGSSVQVPARYQAVDPCRLPDPPIPTTLMHGTNDSIVPVLMSREYVGGHPRSTCLELPCGHYELIDPESEQFAALLAVIMGE